METTDGTPPTAAGLIRLLDTPEGKRPRGHPTADRVTGNTRTTAPIPVHLALIDHLAACGQELADHARASTIGPVTPPPTHPADLYAWARQNTPAAYPGMQRALDAIEWRHALEHAERLGDTETLRLAIRREPCPTCATFGLAWHRDTRRAVCLNRDCRTRGMPSAWTLKQIAAAHAAKTAKRAAT